MHRMCIIQGLNSVYVHDICSILYSTILQVYGGPGRLRGPAQAAQDGCFPSQEERGREPNIYVCVCVWRARRKRRRGAQSHCHYNACFTDESISRELTLYHKAALVVYDTACTAIPATCGRVTSGDIWKLNINYPDLTHVAPSKPMILFDCSKISTVHTSHL